MGTKKLTDADVAEIRRSRDSDAELAERFGISAYYVHEIKVGRARKDGRQKTPPPRQYNKATAPADACCVGFCQVCGRKLYRWDVRTDGDGGLIEVCDRGHRVKT